MHRSKLIKDGLTQPCHGKGDEQCESVLLFVWLGLMHVLDSDSAWSSWPGTLPLPAFQLGLTEMTSNGIGRLSAQVKG
jgi:hypothetical protein